MKNPFTSITVYGLAIAALASFLPSVGINVNVDAANDFVEHAKGGWPKVIEAFGFLLALYGRWKATQPLSFSRKNDF